MAKCSLSKDINTCPFCDLETMKCNDTAQKCAFRVDDKHTDKYVRTERWYEKYYRKWGK